MRELVENERKSEKEHCSYTCMQNHCKEARMDVHADDVEILAEGVDGLHVRHHGPEHALVGQGAEQVPESGARHARRPRCEQVHLGQARNRHWSRSSQQLRTFHLRHFRVKLQNLEQ